MGGDILSLDSLTCRMKSSIPSFQNAYSLLLKDVKEHDILKDKYNLEDTSLMGAREKEKVAFIQQSILKKERLYDNEMYVTLDVLKEQIRLAKKLPDYRNILSQCNKMDKLSQYISISPHIKNEHQKVVSICEQGIENYVSSTTKISKRISQSLTFTSYMKRSISASMRFAAFGAAFYFASLLNPTYFSNSPSLDFKKDSAEENFVLFPQPKSYYYSQNKPVPKFEPKKPLRTYKSKKPFHDGVFIVPEKNTTVSSVLYDLFANN